MHALCSAVGPGLPGQGCPRHPAYVLRYLEARATRPVAAALAVRMERAISTDARARIELLLCGWV